MVIERPWLCTANVKHELTASPSSKTVHDPHSPSLQARLVPGKPRSTRSVSASDCSGSTSTAYVVPLTFSEIGIFTRLLPPRLLICSCQLSLSVVSNQSSCVRWLSDC